MVDEDPEIRKFSLMDSEHRNIELGVLYDFLPTFEFPATTEPVGAEKWNDEVEALSKRADQREHSEYKQRLAERYRKLIVFAQVTQPYQDFLTFEYEELFTYGIERGSSMGKFNSEYEYWQKVLGWNILGNGGIFDTKTAPEIERQLLKSLQTRQLRRKVIFEIEIQKDGFQMLLDQIVNSAREDDKVRRMLMSEEEMEEHKKRVEKGDEVAREYIAREGYADSLLRRWHSDYLTKYGDEP